MANLSTVRTRSNMTGFSLIELTVVLLIMSLLATVAVRSTSELGFQVRYEQTQDRLKLIKQAIVGTPNGQQAVNGFVADMGRLPQNLRELIDNRVAYSDCDVNPATDTDGDGNAALDQCLPWATGNCYDASNAWLAIFNQQACLSSNVTNSWRANVGNLGVGWHGPYLAVTDNPASNNAFTDGWGTETDNLFYGWRYEQALNTAMLGDANAANDQTDSNGIVRLIVQSFGRDGVQTNSLPTGDYADDEPANALQNDAGINYPTALVDKDDWLVDLAPGMTASFKVANSGACGFNHSPAYTDLRACRNASGRWRESGCQLSQSSCAAVNSHDPATTSADKITLWNSQANYCQIAKDDCTGSGFTWDLASSSCHITKAACAALSQPGLWTGASACRLEGAQCEVLAGAGKWNTATQSCEFDATSCAAASGVWDAATASCDLNRTDCINPSHPGTWDCNINQQTCTVAGGAWHRCDFTPAQCTGMAGGAYISRCEFSASACQRAGGAWQADSWGCAFTLPLTAPTTSAQCAAMGGQSNSYCAFDTQANCEAQNGTWNTVTVPHQCEFTAAQCLTKSGTPQEGDCAIARAEHDGTVFDPPACTTATGAWRWHQQALCMNVFYRSNGGLTVVSSTPTVVEENGNNQTVNFSFNNPTLIPVGANAIGIYEYDGDCNTDNPLYPADRTTPLHVDFAAHTTLPTLNW